MTLKEVMSFNKMRKLTKSVEQVIRSIEGSKVVELSQDKKMIRKILPKEIPNEEEG